MLMSIFSPFDALCSESASTGWKKKLLVTADPNIKTQKQDVDYLNIKDTHHQSQSQSPSPSRFPSPPADVKKPSKPQTKPRFAPEFDGVFCFETIIPY
ncbi:hypothetical protein OSB04_016963 [Centaurea solstitialis]|uniref:Uncharacterized protein n=1 Tax=Centaurea solstitialis TaxID=347529 RepID=A0AA38T9N1_9ASTR|nr:hypothetical protein OSB04_016963 [Centaurea solstitialis]